MSVCFLRGPSKILLYFLHIFSNDKTAQQQQQKKTA